MAYQGENDREPMPRAQYNFARHWPTSEDFHRQCDHHQVDAWNRRFLADTHDIKMERIAVNSGFYAPLVFERMAKTLLERERARGLAQARARRSAMRGRHYY